MKAQKLGNVLKVQTLYFPDVNLLSKTYFQIFFYPLGFGPMKRQAKPGSNWGKKVT